MRRAVRKRPGRPDQALGITAERRDRLLAVCGNDLIGLRNKVLITVGFDTLCRRSELVALRVEDFLIDEDGTHSVLVRRAKNDQSGNGRTAHLSAQTYEILSEWLARTELTKGPLLRPVYKNKVAWRSLSPTIVGEVLKLLATQAGLPAQDVSSVSGHSLRVGAAQTLVKRGFGLLPIMAAGGWRSANIVARYTENVKMNPWA